jgi:apurinic endonuclease APN1
MRYLGAHVSTAGGLANAITAATTLGINTIQIHPSAPQRWITKPIDSAQTETLVKHQKNSPVKLVFAHAIYLINLANPEKQKFHLSKMAIVEYLNFTHNIDTIARYYESDLKTGGVVVHVGSAVHSPSKEEALTQSLKGINWILEQAPFGQLLLESSAGSGQVIGAMLQDLLWLREHAEQKERIGIALDTEHMFASGYNWKSPDVVLAEVESLFPLSLVKLIHLNDSKVPCGSKKDRHENLGEGLIGEESLKQIVTNPLLKDIPMVLETPRMGESIAAAKIDVDKLLSWAKV